MADKYISKYSNGKEVSAAQYITEMICETKAKMDKKDLHYRFWTNKEWSKFYRDQIATANKLVKKYGHKAIINALKNKKASRTYSLRSPFLLKIIKSEYEILKSQPEPKPRTYNRDVDTTKIRKTRQKRNILSRLEEIDNEQEER